MKKLSYAFGIIASVALSASGFAQAIATKTTTTTISGGTISEWMPSEAVVIQSPAVATPARYLVTRETTFVDEAGAPVTVETIRRGLPVTVQYVRDGDRTLASRIVVHREAPMTKARAKAMRDYYDKLAETLNGAEKAKAEALEEYYDKLEEELKD